MEGDLASIAARLAAGSDATQTRAVLGEAPLDTIRSAEALIQSQLARPLASWGEPYVSVGITIPFALDDGQRCVLKLTRPSPTVEPAVVVQAQLEARGVPFARVLIEPTRCGAATAHVMSHLDVGETVRYDAETRRLMATSLAHLVDLGRAISIPDALIRRHRIRATLWGRPHSAIFDFDATTAGAESIDAVATRARDRLATNDDPPVLVHDDWSLQNVGIRQGSLCAVFDGDSLIATSEASAVAHADAFHSQDWRGIEDPPASYYLSVEDTWDFIDCYARARDRRWSAAERATIEASLIFRLAYQARCAHAFAPQTRGPARERLEAFATHFGYDA